jgi:3-oxoacyl-[acyl-carrier-protein] synthase-1
MIEEGPLHILSLSPFSIHFFYLPSSIKIPKLAPPMEVYAGAENIISSLGFTAGENTENILADRSGINIDFSKTYSPSDLPLSKVDYSRFSVEGNYTILEKMFIQSITDSLSQSDVDASSDDTLFVFTTTKGNINLLNNKLSGEFARERIYLYEMARVICAHFNNPNKALIVSNACISGVLGIVYAERMIRSGKYRNVIVSGGDLMSEFIVSGFQSFQSLSEKPCKPFDNNRDGLTLGEGCGTLILSADKNAFAKEPFRVLGGAGSNDANHISGPSRTGEGLLLAVNNALKISKLRPEDIDYISAHGTATDYNDEMEAKAFSRAKLEEVPLNSVKGYVGHTLGAAGVIEAAICLQSMRMNMLFRSAGYENHGVSTDINVIKESETTELNTCLKTGSGFGGSNAAIIFRRI